jgi:LemA protein
MQLFILVILAAIVLYVISVYNGLVTIRTRIQASIQEIGNQLKRQSELIPNLEESAKRLFSTKKEIIRASGGCQKISN